MKFVDLFAGVGGFRLGLEHNGHECVYSSEIDKYARAVYEYQWEQPAGDITKIKAADVPDHDILCGGFPCQPFSIAGKRKGFQDIRGTLFGEIIRIAKEKRPGILFLENVKGLLSIDNGRCFATILLSLEELGYSVEWEVLNSKNFGVPQNRERVFIIGHLGDGSGSEIFPLGKSNPDCSEANGKEPGRLAAPVTTQGQKNCRGTFITRTRSDQQYQENDVVPPIRQGDKQEVRILCRDGTEKNQKVASTLTGGGNSGGNHRDMDLLIGTLRTHKDGEGFRPVRAGICPTIPARAREDGSGQPCIVLEKKKVRINEPKIEDIVKYLRASRKDANISIAEIERQFGNQAPHHWFEKPKHASLPSVDDWIKLKEILEFDDKYDSIMTDHRLMTEWEIMQEHRERHQGKGHGFGVVEYEPSDISQTLTGFVEKTHALNIGTHIRRLTPVECERLQGFPDSWTKFGIIYGNKVEISDTQRYKMMGNAVTVNVIKEIASRL